MKKLSNVLYQGLSGVFFFCKGCDDIHILPVKEYNPQNRTSVWDWDGNVEKPTFSPSISVTYPNTLHGDAICHSFVRNGQIQYLNDCTHELKGQTIDLPNIPEEYNENY